MIVRTYCPYCFTSLRHGYDGKLDIWYISCKRDNCYYKVDIALTVEMIKKRNWNYARRRQ